MKRSPLFIICIIGLVDLSSFGLIIPLMPTYAHRFGASATFLGLMLGCYSLAQFVFAPILGRWSDRIGRRPVLLISVAGSVFAHALLGVADLSSSVWLLFLARILDGVTGANIATAQAYIADVTTGEERARGMGIFGAMIGLGFVVGPAMGFGLMALGRVTVGEQLGTCFPAFGAALVSMIAFLMILRYLPEPKTHVDLSETGRRPRSVLAALQRVGDKPRIRELLVMFAALTFAFVFLEATFVYICKDRFGLTENTVMLGFVYFGVLMVIVRGGLVGRLAKLFGEPFLIAVGPPLTACGFLLIAASQYWPGLWVLLVACVPIAVGTGITEPSIQSLLSRHAGDNEQGLTLGAAHGLASLARGIVPIIAGAFYDLSPSLPYLIGGGIYLLAGIMALSIRGGQRQALDASTVEARDLDILQIADDRPATH